MEEKEENNIDTLTEQENNDNVLILPFQEFFDL